MVSLLRRLLLAAGCIAFYSLVAVSFHANPSSAGCLVSSVVVLAFGFFVLSRNRRATVNRWFFLFSSTVSLFLLTAYLLHVAVVVGIERVKLAVWLTRNGLLLIPPALAFFTYHFVGRKYRSLRILAWMALFSMLPFVVMNLLGLYVTEYRNVGQTFVPGNRLYLYRLSAIATIFWVFVPALVIFVECFRSESRSRRPQYYMFLSGFCIASFPALLGYLPAFNRPWYPSLMTLLWPLFPLALGIAVIRFSLFDIKVVLRRTLPYAVGTALIGVLYGLSLAALRLVGASLNVAPHGGSLVMLLLLVGLAFQPLLEGLQKGLDWLFFRREAELDTFLSQAAEHYRSAKSHTALARMVVEDVRRELSLEGAVMLLGQGTASVVVASPDALEEGLLSLDVTCCGGAQGVILGGEGDEAVPTQQCSETVSALSSAGMKLAVAFIAGNMNCVLACKQKLSHLSFSARDVKFVDAVVGQAGTAFMRMAAEEEAHTAHRLTDALFQSMTNAVALVDSTGTVVSCNPAFESVLDASSGDSVEGCGLPDDLGARAAEMPVEVEVKGCVLLASAKKLAEEEGGPATLLVLTDVTELRSLQEADSRRAALAQLGATISSINHEVGNILSPVGVHLRRARQRCKEEELATSLDIVLARVEMLESLSRELRDFYRDPAISLKRVVLRSVVESVLNDMSASFGAAWVPPDTEGLGLEILADPQKLKQVLANLLMNAWDAMGEKKEWTLVAEERSGKVLICLKDNGEGIAKELQPRLFQPFVTTKKGKGTGLGLPIARRIVEAHGAEISLEGEPGRGATVKLLWPSAEE